MTFSEVEAVIGGPLPPAAGRYAAWWSNNPSNNVMTRIWLEAGYRTERVDLGGRKLVFRRAGPRSPAASPAPAPSQRGGRSDVLETIRRKLGGSVRMAPGYDPTAPTAEGWDAQG
jgi:hypothetical protein